MASDAPSHYALRLDFSHGEPEPLYRFLQQSLQEDGLHNVGSDVMDDLKLVAEEWFANVMHHGYGSSSQGHLEIDLEIGEDAIRLRFRDSGVAFNPLDVEKSQAEHDLSTGGMGLTIIRSLTDTQSYERHDEHNVFTVTKLYNPE